MRAKKVCVGTYAPTHIFFAIYSCHGLKETLPEEQKAYITRIAPSVNRLPLQVKIWEYYAPIYTRQYNYGYLGAGAPYPHHCNQVAGRIRRKSGPAI